METCFISTYQSLKRTILTVILIEEVYTILSGIVYIISSIRHTIAHDNSVKNQYSSFVTHNLKFLRVAVISFLLILIFSSYLILSSLNLSTGFVSEYFFMFHKQYFILWVLLSFIIYFIGYLGIKQSHFILANVEDTEKIKVQQYPEKYNDLVIDVITSDKLYLDSDLTLKRLSEKCNLNAYVLTSVLNNNLNKSFYNFVNEYRVEEVKNRLSDPEYDNQTLLAIGLDSGFSSKSTFNSIFKKFTGQTPNQFKNNVQKLHEV